MQEIYGAPQVFSVKGTVAFSGLSNATWEIIEFNPSLGANVANSVQGGLVVTRGVTERVRTAKVTVLVKGSATLAQALAAIQLPEIMTQMTVAGADLPALALENSGVWNLDSIDEPMAQGEFAKISFALIQFWNGSGYVHLSKVSS